MDPLSVLRDYSKENQLAQIVLEGERIKFADKYSFHKKTPTGYKRQGVGGSSNEIETYDLETLVFFLQHPSDKWMQYVRQAREAGVPQVTFVDRKELTDYLTGKIDRSDKILSAPELVLPPAVSELEPIAKKARLESTDASVNEAQDAWEIDTGPTVGKERALRDRNSQMSILGKSFKDVIGIAATAKRDMEEQARKKAKERAAEKALQASKVKKPTIQNIPSGRYSRPAIATAETGDFAIPSHGVPPPPPPGNPDAGSGANLGAPPPPPTSQPPPSVAQQAEKQRAKERERSRAQAAAQPRAPSKKKPSASREARPVIIVPAAASSKITMLNVKDFLEQGIYKSNEAAKKEGIPKQQNVVIQRKLGRQKPVPFEVTDKAPPKHHNDWKRVVAVFVTGASWQFKDWPRGADASEMANTFHDVLGLHVSLRGEPVSDALKSWNVRRFVLHPHDRHGDQSVVLDIYNALDKFVASRSAFSHLIY